MHNKESAELIKSECRAYATMFVDVILEVYLDYHRLDVSDPEGILLHPARAYPYAMLRGEPHAVIFNPASLMPQLKVLSQHREIDFAVKKLPETRNITF